jgi:GNAT superfamily N-acetyltransferase
VTVVQAHSPAHVETARELFLEYADWLAVDLCFQGFDQELASLPGDYAPPRGRLLLALVDDRPAGCVALRPLAADTAELKRLYVRENWRGRGIGRWLVERVIDDARHIGYARIQLDSLPTMTSAAALYRSLGFVAREPYYDTPLVHTVFMELLLSGSP